MQTDTKVRYQRLRDEYAPKTSSEVAIELLEEETDAHNNPRVITGIASYGSRLGSDDAKYTWTRLDEITRGIQKGMTLLGGRPKAGKSMVVCSLLPNIAEQVPANEVVRVISLEMSALSYQRRVASILADLPDPIRIQSGHLTSEERERYHKSVQYLAGLPIEYYDQSLNFATLNSLIVSPQGPKTFWWVLDNFGLMRDLGQTSNQYGAMVELANNLQRLCQRQCPGMIVHHLNRLAAGRRPTLESIAGTDQLSRNVDMFIGLWRRYHDRDDVDQKLLEEGEPGEMVIESRNGAGGIVPVWWDAHKAHYTEMKPEEVDLLTQLFPDDKPKGARR